MISRKWLAAAGLAAAVSLVGVQPGADATAPVPFTWLTSADGPFKLYADGVTSTWHSTFAIMNSDATHNCQVPPDAEPAFWFADYDDLTDAIENDVITGKKPAKNGCAIHYQAVVVDYENWDLTPAQDKQNWVHYIQLAYQTAHSHGLKVIQAMSHGVPQDNPPSWCKDQIQGMGPWQIYFKCNAPGIEAQNADFVDIQAQHEEGTPAFGSEVKQGVDEATNAGTGKPGVTVLAGMRSSFPLAPPNCRPMDPKTLETDWDVAAKSGARGAWLNDNCDEKPFVDMLNDSTPPGS